MTRPTKREAQLEHARRRFVERLPKAGVTPEQISQRIRNHESLKTWTQSAYMTLHALIVNDAIELFLYDRRRHQVVTVLPAQDGRVTVARWKLRHRLMEERIRVRTTQSRLVA